MVLFFIIQSSYSQNSSFEGTIVYDFSFYDKSQKMSSSDSKRIMGTEQVYYFKKNKYKAESNGEMEFTQFYTGRDTLYMSMNNSNAIFFTDTKKLKDKVISSKIINIKESIAGYECKLLKIQSRAGTTYYYYSDKLKTNPSGFKNHKEGLWAYFLEETKGCLPIKIIADYKESKLELTAKLIEKKPIEDIVFSVPKGLPLIANPE